MRIAVWYHLPSGGARRALFDNVKGLVARGHAVDVWCPSTADRKPVPLSALTAEYVLPMRADRRGGVLARVMPYTDSGPLARIRAMDRHAREFADAINDRGYDVVFANSCVWFATPFVGRYLRLPRVLYLPEPYRPLYEARPVLPWIAEPEPESSWWNPQTLKKWIGSAARVHALRVQAREELVSIRTFDRVLVNSRFTRENVRATFNIDATVCYPGVDVERLPLADGHRERFVLSVGEFSPHKDPLFVIRAVGAAKGKPPLVWVANRADADTLAQGQALAEKLGVTLTVKTALDERELVALYQRAASFVYAPRLEPFGLAPLEANACGTPVITCAEGGVRETIIDGENGLIGDFTPAEMGGAIDRLLDQPDLARRLGRNGAALVRSRWSQDAATMRLERHLCWASRHGESELPTLAPPALPVASWS